MQAFYFLTWCFKFRRMTFTVQLLHFQLKLLKEPFTGQFCLIFKQFSRLILGCIFFCRLWIILIRSVAKVEILDQVVTLRRVLLTMQLTFQMCERNPTRRGLLVIWGKKRLSFGGRGLHFFKSDMLYNRLSILLITGPHNSKRVLSSLFIQQNSHLVLLSAFTILF